MAITISLKKAAEESDLTIRTLYNYIGTGKLETRKVGRRRLVVMQSLEKLLSRDQASPVPVVKEHPQTPRTAQ